MFRIRLGIQLTLTLALVAIELMLFCPTAIAEVSDRSQLFEQGRVFFDAGNYERAYDLFWEVFKVDPENLDINFFLGRAAFEIGNYEMALMAFERILIAKPEANRVKLEMARTYYRLGLRENQPTRDRCPQY